MHDSTSDTPNAPAWYEIHVPGGELTAELIGEELISLGAAGLVPDDTLTILKVFVAAPQYSDDLLARIKELYEGLKAEEILPDGEITCAPAQLDDWVTKWRNALGPIRAGKRFVIVPPEVEYAPEYDDLVIAILPRMAFGTGEHETTRMALELLEESVIEGARVLDLGTGTGVLALAALLKGAGEVVGIDNEEESITECFEHFAAHGFAEKARVYLGDALAPGFPGVEPASFDMILANILFRPVMAGLETWTRLAKPGGIIILTGVRAEEEGPEMVRHAESLGWSLDRDMQLGEWYSARLVLGS